MGYNEYREAKVLKYLDSIKNGWRTFPPSLQIGLTDMCFNRCITCGHWRMEDKQKLPIEVLMPMLEYGRVSGLETVCYSGGDPFAYGINLDGVMDWHISNHVDYGFITAGFRPTTISMDLLREAKFIRCSLDAVTDPTYTNSRGYGVRVEDVLSSIEDLCSSGCKVGLGITIHKNNADQLEKIFEFATNNFIQEVRCWVVRHEPDLIPTEKQSRNIKNIFRDWLQIFTINGVSNNINTCWDILNRSGEKQLDFDHCLACYYQLFIDAKCDVYPCCITAGDTESKPNCEPLGNIRSGMWKSIITARDKFSNKDRSELPVCCENGCITRLSTINHYAEKHINTKHFL